MLTALVCCIWMILNALDISLINAIKELDQKSYLNIFNTDLNSGSNFWKHFIGGALITISMTGMDQEMMQKILAYAL